MSVTRILCDRCGFPIIHCTCSSVPPEQAGSVRSSEGLPGSEAARADPEPGRVEASPVARNRCSPTTGECPYPNWCSYTGRCWWHTRIDSYAQARSGPGNTKTCHGPEAKP